MVYLMFVRLTCWIALLARSVRHDVLASIGVRHELPTRFVIPAGGGARWRAMPSGSTCRLGSGQGSGKERPCRLVQRDRLDQLRARVLPVGAVSGSVTADRALLAALLHRLPGHVLKRLPLVVHPDTVIMERRVQTCRRELLDRTLIWNRSHLLHEQFLQRAPAASGHPERSPAPATARAAGGC